MPKATKTTPIPELSPDGPDPITQNPLRQRRLFEAIELAFDEKEGRYRNPGDSDATVAKATAFSEDYVAKVRRSAYGEIKTDPAVKILLDNLASLGIEVTEMAEMLRDLKTRIEKADQNIRAFVGRRPV